MFRTLFAKSRRDRAPSAGSRVAAKDRDERPDVGDADFRRLGGPFCSQASRHRMLVLLDEETRLNTGEGRG